MVTLNIGLRLMTYMQNEQTRRKHMRLKIDWYISDKMRTWLEPMLCSRERVAHITDLIFIAFMVWVRVPSSVHIQVEDENRHSHHRWLVLPRSSSQLRSSESHSELHTYIHTPIHTCIYLIMQVWLWQLRRADVG